MEDERAVEETFRSIARQRYEIVRPDVYVVLEKEDRATLNIVLKYIDVFAEKDLGVYIFVNGDKRKTKASSINALLKFISNLYEAVTVFDGGDKVLDERYVEKATKLIVRGYCVVGAKVYRAGYSIVGKLSYIDTILWYEVGLPGIAKIVGTPPVSGEGLTVSMKFLTAVGGFPEVLAEDAYLSILAAKHGCSIALLDTAILEGAPMNLRSMVKQRMRWYRGYIECLKHTLTKYRRYLDKKTIMLLTYTYLQPVALTAPFISVVILALALVPFIKVPTIVVTLAKIELISIATAPMYLVLTRKLLDPVIVLVPLHWIFQGAIALATLMPVKVSWMRTLQRSYISSHDINMRATSSIQTLKHV
jgi:cellulose synthase/poly-beta-1,6-N-acetylglucosamine synthase-like glycosyltransferase